MNHAWKRSACCCFAALACLLPCVLAAQTLGDGIPAPVTEPLYRVEIHMISIPCEKGNEGFPEALQSLVLSLDPRDVEVIGGAIGNGSDERTNPAASTAPESLTGTEDNASSMSDVPVGQAMLFIHADDAAMESFLNQLKGDARSTISNAPAIQVAAGTPANVMTGSSRPFCAALIPDKSGVRNVFRTVYEGSRFQVRLENPTSEGVDVFCQVETTSVKKVRNLALRHPLAGHDAGDIAQVSYQIQVPALESDCNNLQTKVRFGENTLAVIGWDEIAGPETGIPVPGKKRIFTNIGRKTESVCQILCVKVHPLTREESTGTEIFSLGDNSEAAPAVPIVPIR